MPRSLAVLASLMLTKVIHGTHLVIPWAQATAVLLGKFQAELEVRQDEIKPSLNHKRNVAKDLLPFAVYVEKLDTSEKIKICREEFDLLHFGLNQQI